MMKNIDYNKFDSINVYVKGTLTEEIIESYKLLGWQLTEENENKKYEDIVDLTFIRPHNIENKDELQLTQVFMEEKINRLSKIKRHKHSFSFSLGLSYAVFGFALLCLGILSVLNVIKDLGVTFGAILLSLGGILLVFGGILIPKIFKKEKVKYEKERSQLEKELHEICQKATTLTGGRK